MIRALLLSASATACCLAGSAVDVSGPVGEPRTFTLRSDADLRDGLPPDGVFEFTEHPGDPRVATGNKLWDAVHALACHEARLNAVSEIRDGAYRNGAPIPLEAYQTGEKWNYVWTRDLAYATALGLAPIDPQRSLNSLRFKTSLRKPSVAGDAGNRFIVQDTGSGGSWPVSSDRVSWAFGMCAVIDFLPAAERRKVAREAYATLAATLRQDEKVLRDPVDGLFRGEQSFLDWREQSYPLWTKDDVTAIAASKSLSTNVAFLRAMRSAALFGSIIGEDPDPWERKAKNLRRAIHQSFFDPDRGCYSSLLLRDGLVNRRVERDDLLGTALAVFEKVPPSKEAAAILARHPVGPFGPPVVSPQETTVPIYHNCGIWPFATAWWTLAGAEAGHAGVVDAGFRSIADAAVRNLSHMENLDFTTGAAWASHHGIEGPVVNSRRQIWSVAGALGVFHSALFGMESDLTGIRFRPRVPAALARDLGRKVELRNFSYFGKRIDVTLELPEPGEGGGFLTVRATGIDGKPATGKFVAPSNLADHSRWLIRLGPPADASKEPPMRRIDPAGDFAPAAPEWRDGGIAETDGRVRLAFSHPDAENVTFRVFRDGAEVACDLRETTWTDPDPAGVIHEYSVEAVDGRGVASHPTRSVRLEQADRRSVLPAPAFDHVGGTLREGSHFMDWGKPGDSLTSPAWTPDRTGRHLVRFEFANGAGPVNTGITCGVKRFEVLDGENVIHKSYAVFPQSGDWERHDLTVPVELHLDAERSYRFRLTEGPGVGNMSYLEHNADYTAHRGGGAEPSHFIDIFALHLLRLDP